MGENLVVNYINEGEKCVLNLSYRNFDAAQTSLNRCHLKDIIYKKTLTVLK